MRITRPQAVGASVLSLALLGATLAGGSSPAWAEDAVPSTSMSTSTAVAAPAPEPASTVNRPLARGCTGVTPRKPWRLVAKRVDPTSTEVALEWAAVGCTVGYRVSIQGADTERVIDVAGGGTSSLVVRDLPPTQSYRITVTSIGSAGDGGVSGVFRLAASSSSATPELTIDFPDSGPTGPVAPPASGDSPWVNPELSWTAPVGSDVSTYRLRVTGSGVTVVDKEIPGTATKVRLGEEISAGTPHSVTLTPVMADGREGKPSRLTFGNQQAPRPEQVTGIAPVVQFSPVTEIDEGRVLGYEVAFGAQQASKRLFVPAPPAGAAEVPWIAVDPSFDVVDGSDTALPMTKLVAIVRTITTMGRSPWTPARTITHSEVATAEASYFAGIGHVGDGDTVPRHGFLNVRGSVADVQITDMVWSQSPRAQRVPVTVSVYGPGGTDSPVFTQDVPATHLPLSAEAAWRASDIPLPEGWTAIVLRRGGSEVARWLSTGARPCVAAVSFGDAPTDLPQMWKDSWCAS